MGGDWTATWRGSTHLRLAVQSTIYHVLKEDTMYTLFTFFAFVLNFAFELRNWGLNHPTAATWAAAIVSMPIVFLLVLWLVVRPGVLSNYRLWKRKKDAWKYSQNQHIDQWKLIRGLFRFWRMGLTIRWISFGIWPEFSYRWIEWVDWRGMKRPVFHSKSLYVEYEIDWSTGKPFDKSNASWWKGEVEYVFTHRAWKNAWKNAICANWTPLMRVLWGWGRWTLVIFAIVGFILGPLPWFAGFFVPTAATTPESTQIAVAPTSAPHPTATSDPQIEVTTEGYALVVELDRDVPPSEFWRRVNEALSVSCDVCVWTPTIPIPEWVWNIIGNWEFTIVRLPRGMEGYIVAYQTPYGMAVQRVDDHFQPIGNAEPLAETEATIAARDRRFGIGYDNSGWDKPINGYRGDALVTVTESSNAPLIVEARGFAYNFRIWHVAVLIILIIIGVVAYRKIYY